MTAIAQRRSVQTTAAFALYLAASLLLFGRPILHHGGSDCLCIGTTTDEGIVAWGFAWWPHAILHGENPFVSHLVYAPHGINLAHGTLMPTLAMLLWPVTAIGSPLLSYNLATLLAPAVAATAAFHLARTVLRATGTGSPIAALPAGWLFGFSTYLLGQLTGHLNLSFVGLVPLIVEVCVVAALEGRRPALRSMAILAVLLDLQIGLSLEVFATTVGVGALTLLISVPFVGPSGRAAVGRVAAVAAGALIAACVVASPYLYYAVQPGGEPVLTTRTGSGSADLLGFVVPNAITRIGAYHFAGTASHFTAGYVEGGDYLGIPLILLAGIGAWRLRRSAAARVAVIGLIVAVLCALGAHLQVRGRRVIPLPWALVDRLPLISVALPVRIVMFAFLAAAILAALALRGGGGRRLLLTWCLAAVAVASLWPDLTYPFWNSDPGVPRLFATREYRRVLPAGNVLILPVGIFGESMLWAAQARLGFAMASGYVVPPEAPDPYDGPLHSALEYDAVSPAQAGLVARFITAHHITSAVMSIPYARISPWVATLRAVGWRAEVVGGAVVFAARTQPDSRSPVSTALIMRAAS